MKRGAGRRGRKRTKVSKSSSKEFKINWKIIGFGTLFAFLLALTVVGLATGYRFLISTPLLNVKNVKVTGNDHISEKIILSSLNLRKNPNIFQVDIDEASGNLERAPWVRRAIIRRRLPNTLLVEIQEYQPLAIVVADDYFYLSQDGNLFKRVGAGEEYDLPVITGLKSGDFEDRKAYASGILIQVRDLLLWSDGAKWITPDVISEINIDPSEGFSIFLARSNTKIILGKQNLIGGLNRLEKVMDDYSQQIYGAKVIDLRFKERVVARLSSR